MDEINFFVPSWEREDYVTLDKHGRITIGAWNTRTKDYEPERKMHVMDWIALEGYEGRPDWLFRKFEVRERDLEALARGAGWEHTNDMILLEGFWEGEFAVRRVPVCVSEPGGLENTYTVLGHIAQQAVNVEGFYGHKFVAVVRKDFEYGEKK